MLIVIGTNVIMDDNESKVMRVSELIERREKLFNSNHRYGDFVNCYYKEHEHYENEGSILSVEDPSVFRLGEQFYSYTDLLDRLDEHSRKSFIHYWRRDSRTVDGAHMKTSRPIAPNLKYYSVKFACVFGGQKFMSRGKGKRPSVSRRTNCPSHITVRANKCGESLEVISVCNHHNHPVSKELYHQMPHERRLPPDIKEDVLDLLRLGFNQKRVRDYIEWETGKKLSNKDIHNLLTINKRPKVLVSEKRAIQLERILTDFEVNKDHINISKKCKRKNQKEEPESIDINISLLQENEELILPDDISDESVGLNPEERFPIGNEIEISIEDGITCVPTIDGNYLTYIHDRESISPDSNVANLVVTDEEPTLNTGLSNGIITQTEKVIFNKYVPSDMCTTSPLSKENIYLEGKIPNDVFIFNEGNNVAQIDNLNMVTYNNEKTISEDNELHSEVHLNNTEDEDINTADTNYTSDNSQLEETTDEENEVSELELAARETIKIEKQDEVVYFSDSDIVYDDVDFISSSNFDQEDTEPTCCETCGNLQSGIQSDIDKLRRDRDQLLKETASLREQKSKLLSEILCLKNGSESIDCDDRGVSLNELTNDNVWIVIG